MMPLRDMSAQAAVTLLAAMAMLALLVPLHEWMLDLLLSANLAFSLAVFALALLLRRPSRLEGFPGLLVVSSLGRVILALAVARSILLGGNGGSLVSGLGSIGGQGGWLAGIVVVLFVALIDLLVISAGMVRVSEVLARFALDALPGRQMAVDAAVADGRLSPEQAADRQQKIDSECAFYGAMDGAARFLRGDCIATLIAVGVTPVAALLMQQQSAGGMELFHRYLQLATGHGLVILLPAVLMGGAGAMVLSRAGTDRIFGAEIAGELVMHPVALGAASVALLATAFVSPTARIPLMIMAVTLAAIGLAFRRYIRTTPVPPGEAVQDQKPLNRIEVGMGLTHLIAQEQFEQMLTQSRQRVQRVLGLPVGPFIVSDSAELGMDRLAVVVSDQVVGRCAIRAGRLLVVGGQADDYSGATSARCGARTVGAWIAPEHRQRAEGLGLEVLQPEQALLRLVEETLVATAADSFDLQQTSELIAQVEKTHPQAVAVARERGLDAVLLRRVGAALLAEGAGIHNPVGLLQAVAEAMADTDDVGQLVEATRKRLARSICHAAAPDGTILAVELAADVAEELAFWQHDGRLAIPPERGEQWLGLLVDYGMEAYRLQHPIAVLCDAQMRPVVSMLITDSGQNLLAIAFDELEPDYRIEYLGTISEATLQAGLETATRLEER